MSTVTLSLAEPAARWLDEQVSTGRYANVDAYLAELVERDRIDAGKLACIRAAVATGLASGTSKHSVTDILNEGIARHANG